MLDRFAATNFADDLFFFTMAIFWNDSEDRFAGDLVRPVTENALCALIPVGNDSIESLGHDCVVRRLNNRREAHRGRFPLLALSHVDDRRDPADNFAIQVFVWDVNAVQETRPFIFDRHYRFVSHGLAREHAIDARLDDSQSFVADYLNNRFARDLFRGSPEHFRVSVADVTVTQVARATRKHDGGLREDLFELGLFGAQSLLSCFALS